MNYGKEWVFKNANDKIDINIYFLKMLFQIFK